MNQSPKYDVLQLELFRHSILSIADELEVNLTRTAYSLLIYEYKDYCIGFLDENFRLIAQSAGSLPIFVADLGDPVRDAVEIIGAANLETGDIFLTNYAPVSGQHINNVVVATPLMDRDGALIGYICVRAHWSDLGGLAPSSMSWDARDIFQEGTQYRGLRLMRAGRAVPEVLKTIEANTRQPKHVMGDLNAQIGACQLGLNRWQERIVGKWAPADIRGLMNLIQSSSSELARERLRAILPDGVYRSQCYMDDAGPHPGSEPLLLKLKLEVRDGTVNVDLSEMPDQSISPMNAGRGAGISAVRVAFKALLDPEIPVNEGFFDPITCTFRDGTIVSASPTAPLSYWNNTITTIIDLVFRAIGEKCPDLVPAGHHATFGIFMFFGQNADGGWWMFVDTAHGGRGGHKDGEGFSPLKTMGHGDTKDIPVEVTERRFPLICHSYGFRPGTGGTGLHRGGDGTERIIEIAADNVLAEFSIDRTLDPPWGMNGGGPGIAGDIEVRRAGIQDWASFKKAGGLRLNKGDLVRIRAAGGGGWGLSSH
jgi:N-methylhydantoinase B